MEKQKRAVVTPERLKAAIEASWCAETSDAPIRYAEYGGENPPYGQCRATALVVHDYLGGSILFSIYKGSFGAHYYNMLDDGTVVDLTRQQFGKPPHKGIVLLPPQRTNRAFVKASCRRFRQYELLKDKVAAVLSEVERMDPTAHAPLRRK